jgi:hypothetical protein
VPSGRSKSGAARIWGLLEVVHPLVCTPRAVNIELIKGIAFGRFDFGHGSAIISAAQPEIMELYVISGEQ